jgi:hypothetical protein
MRIIQSVALGALTLAACGSGPYEAVNTEALALTVGAQFVPPPTGSLGSVELDLAAVRRCYDTPAVQNPSEVVLTGSFRSSATYSSGITSFEFAAYPIANLGISDLASQPVCGIGDFTNSRFFRFQGISDSGSWFALGQDLVYSINDGKLSPLGPEGPTVDLPAGYSFLRRACSDPPGSIVTTVSGPDQPITLSQISDPSVSDNWGLLASLESEERAFLQSCGVTAPADDLGVPITFDIASQMIFTPDGGSIVYLHQTSPRSFVDVRSLRLADGAATEIAQLQTATKLAAAPNGQLYVASVDDWSRVTPAASGPALVEMLPVPEWAQLSPDGRWFAFSNTDTATNTPITDVWDIARSVEVSGRPHGFIQWSPSSELVVHGDGNSLEIRPVGGTGTLLTFLGPARTSDPGTFGGMDSVSGLPVATLAWPSPSAPVIASLHAPWIFATARTPEGLGGREFGWVGLDLWAAGATPVKTALDASDGLLDLVPNAPPTPFVLVWAEKCLGLYRTVCTHTLLEVDAASGDAKPVATSDSEGTVAVSPDLRQVAIGTADGIFLKPLP